MSESTIHLKLISEEIFIYFISRKTGIKRQSWQYFEKLWCSKKFRHSECLLCFSDGEFRIGWVEMPPGGGTGGVHSSWRRRREAFEAAETRTTGLDGKTRSWRLMTIFIFCFQHPVVGAVLWKGSPSAACELSTSKETSSWHTAPSRLHGCPQEIQGGNLHFIRGFWKSLSLLSHCLKTHPCENTQQVSESRLSGLMGGSLSPHIQLVSQSPSILLPKCQWTPQCSSPPFTALFQEGGVFYQEFCPSLPSGLLPPGFHYPMYGPLPGTALNTQNTPTEWKQNPKNLEWEQQYRRYLKTWNLLKRNNNKKDKLLDSLTRRNEDSKNIQR